MYRSSYLAVDSRHPHQRLGAPTLSHEARLLAVVEALARPSADLGPAEVSVAAAQAGGSGRLRVRITGPVACPGHRRAPPRMAPVVEGGFAVGRDRRTLHAPDRARPHRLVTVQAERPRNVTMMAQKAAVGVRAKTATTVTVITTSRQAAAEAGSGMVVDIEEHERFLLHETLSLACWSLGTGPELKMEPGKSGGSLG